MCCYIRRSIPLDQTLGGRDFTYNTIKSVT